MNSYARGGNSFLSWLHENGHVHKLLRVPLTKQHKRALKAYTPEEVERIIRHEPTTRAGKRAMAILYLLIDAGARVNEAIGLTRNAVGFDRLLVTLDGASHSNNHLAASSAFVNARTFTHRF